MWWVSSNKNLNIERRLFTYAVHIFAAWLHARGAHDCRMGSANWVGWPNQQCARLPNGLYGLSSNSQDCRLGWVAQLAILMSRLGSLASNAYISCSAGRSMHGWLGLLAQPAMRTIAEWAIWPNQQFARSPTGLGSPTSNPHSCLGSVAQPAMHT